MRLVLVMAQALRQRVFQRQITATRAPRASPIFRWDQKRSGRQAVHRPQMSICSGATPAWSNH